MPYPARERGVRAECGRACCHLATFHLINGLFALIAHTRISCMCIDPVSVMQSLHTLATVERATNLPATMHHNHSSSHRCNFRNSRSLSHHLSKPIDPMALENLPVLRRSRSVLCGLKTLTSLFHNRSAEPISTNLRPSTRHNTAFTNPLHFGKRFTSRSSTPHPTSLPAPLHLDTDTPPAQSHHTQALRSPLYLIHRFNRSERAGTEPLTR